MILTLHEDKAVADLYAGLLSCACSGRLRPWGHARSRPVRQRDGSHVTSRPSRAMCAGCGQTHVVLGPAALPRRRDAVETVGDALVRAVNGHGHRTIARDLGHQASTVRNWLREARRQAEWLRQRGVQAGYEIDPGLPPATPRTTPLAEALDALGLAASAAVRRFGWVDVSPWHIIAMLSRGQLLAPRPDG